MRARHAVLGILLAAAAQALSCAHSGGPADLATLTSNSDQVIWEAGQKDLKRKNYEAARQHFKRIVEAFPQSEYAPLARLAVGDAHFQEGGTAAWIMSIGAYREFLTLFPSHPRSDYAQLQVAEAYFKQRNGPDRDQTPTQNALQEYQRLIDTFPSSPLAETARARITECRQSLARAEFLAGYFYQRTRQACRAALARYETVLKSYPDYGRTDEVLFRMSECLVLSGRAPEAPPQLARLLKDYPQSEYAEDARRLMETASQTPAAPVAPPTPSSPAPEPSPSPAAPESPS
jgi:outer membrane protein assembly factor BamD